MWVNEIVKAPAEARKPFVLWFTGLSGSGKSTVADRVYHLLSKQQVKLERLDGDVIRSKFPDTGYEKPDRIAHVARVGRLASLHERKGICSIASLIAPYRASRDLVRALCKNYIEVFVSTPLEVCEQRDVKGLYAAARRGEIKGFTGIDDPYEKPEKPEIEIDTSKLSLDESVSKIMVFLEDYV